MSECVRIIQVSGCVRITRVEDIRPAKSDRGEDDVAPEEEQVGDAEGGQQVVEHVVHLPVGKNSENNILNKNFQQTISGEKN